MTNCIFVFLHSYKVSLFLKVFQYSLSCFKSFKPTVFSTIFIYFCIFRKYIQERKSCSFGHFKIVRIMRRCHFNYSRSKFHIHIFISNYRYFPIHQWQYHFFSYYILISFIVRIYSYTCIPKHCFRSRCSNYNIFITVFYRISYFPYFPVFFKVIYFIICKGSFIMRTPVYDVFSPVNQSIIVKFYENFLYSS